MAKGNRKRGQSAASASGSVSTGGDGASSSTPPVSPVAQAEAGAAVADLTVAVKEMFSGGRYGNRLAKKQAPGKAGRTVKIRTNFFKLDIKDKWMYHYEISFKADKNKKKKAAGGGPGTRPSSSSAAAGAEGGDQPDDGIELKAVKLVREIFREMVKQNESPGQDFHQRRVVFDGRNNMYAINQKLVNDHKILRFQCRLDGEDRMITAEWKLALVDGRKDDEKGHVLDLADKSQQSVQGLDIALGYPVGLQKIQHTVRFFDPPTGNDNVGMNLYLLQGFKKSVRACQGGYYVNLDRAAGLFQIGGPLLKVFLNILNFGKGPRDPQMTERGFRMDEGYKRKLETELKNFKIKSVIKGAPFNRTYKIDSFTTKSVSEITFRWEEQNRTVTVLQYYREHYGQALQPHLPCVVVGQQRKNYVPIELCNLMDNQYYDKKMNERIQREVTSKTIKPPQERYDAINRSLAQMAAMTAQMVACDIARLGEVVDGRILPPPIIQFGGNSEVQVKEQPLRGNPCDYSGGMFTSTKPILTWALVQVTTSACAFLPILSQFGDKLVVEAKRRGWKLNEKFQTKACTYTGYEQMKLFMASALEKGKIEFLVFALPGRDDIYNDVKRIQNEIALTSQCFLFNAANRGDSDMGSKFSRASKITSPSYVENMIKKMNGKVGGTNSVLAAASVPGFLKNNNVMIVGMDVYHPGAYTEDIQSLVGIVASYTSDFSQYFHQAMAQPQKDPKNPKRVEEIREAVYIVLKDFFQRYKGKNRGMFPNHIIVLRDGVSEGQFLHVRDWEVHQIHRAIADSGFNAQVTFLTVQKRHSFRMFVEFGPGKVRNPTPGTVVDTKVVHEERNEYYLNSHHAIKGTAKPCHYTLIHNEPNLTNDMMQGMSYALCYLSARCDKPISIPVPVHYAHLVAERASKILESQKRAAGHAIVNVNDAIRVHEKLIDKLVYV